VGCGSDGRGWRVTRGGRGVFPGFVTKQKNTTAAVASIKDVLDCTARADALVSGVLDPVMAQRRGCRHGAGLREGAVTAGRGELLEHVGEGRARGAAPDAGPAQEL
jgi:hypothetical protein